MSKYKADKYLQKKYDELFSESSFGKAYQLGYANGILTSYRQAKAILGKEDAKKIWKGLDSNDYFTTIVRTAIELEDEENVTKAEMFAEKLDNAKRQEVSGKKLSDDDVALLEEFMEFLHKKN